jgi:hypothetical protein
MVTFSNGITFSTRGALVTAALNLRELNNSRTTRGEKCQWTANRKSGSGFKTDMARRRGIPDRRAHNELGLLVTLAAASFARPDSTYALDFLSDTVGLLSRVHSRISSYTLILPVTKLHVSKLLVLDIFLHVA